VGDLLSGKFGAQESLFRIAGLLALCIETSNRPRRVPLERFALKSELAD
jgi:hypothetical protein